MVLYCILIQFKISERLEKAALVHLIYHLTTLLLYYFYVCVMSTT